MKINKWIIPCSVISVVFFILLCLLFFTDISMIVYSIILGNVADIILCCLFLIFVVLVFLVTIKGIKIRSNSLILLRAVKGNYIKVINLKDILNIALRVKSSEEECAITLFGNKVDTLVFITVDGIILCSLQFYSGRQKAKILSTIENLVPKI